MAILRLVPASGSAVEIDGDRAVVGRDPGCQVVVNDVSVSRKHARIERWGSNWAVVDQRSANGTFLDGQRVTESVLSAGQELRFGAIAYRVEIDEYEGGATVLLPIPGASPATILQQPPVPPSRPASSPAPTPAAPPRPAAPRPPAPTAPPRPAAPLPQPPPEAPPAPPPVARPTPPPREAPRPPHLDHAPEPPSKRRGLLFWGTLGCSGILLLVLVGFGVVVGGPFLKSRGAVDAARAQLKDMKDGNINSAYARTAASYQAAHSAAAFATFVDRHPGLKGNTASTFTSRSAEDNSARLAGSLAHASGTETVVYELTRQNDEWRISVLRVDGEEAAASQPSTADSGGLTIEIASLNKTPQGQGVAVKIEVRVTGFDLRPEGNLFRVDLAEDLETFGADGRRMDELSRAGLETFDRTTTSATDATATFKTSLTFARPDPGKYRALITIRDKVGQKSKQREVTFDLP